MWLFLAFLAVPLIEIALFIQVGGLIGLWPTLLIVVLTAVLGTALVRSQGVQVLARLRQSMADLNDPTEPLAEGAMILLAGAFLLMPGFFTDTCGLLLLIPQVRQWVIRSARGRMQMRGFAMGTGGTAQQPRRNDVIDAEYEEVAPQRPGPRRPSGWTEH